MIFRAVSSAIICAVLVSLASPHHANADDFPRFEFEGILDLRAARTADTLNWNDEGTGKTEYSGDREDGARFTAEFDQAAGTVIAHFNWDLLGVATARVRPDGDFPLDLVEAFVRYRPVSTSRWRPSVKLGAFFPPVSLENDGIAWTSPHTLTFSAINSWIGEEVRTFGGEASLEYRGEEVDYRGLIGVFAANDPTGAMVASRGWALHDRVTGVFDGINYLSTGADAHFSEVRPFVEVDGIPGAYIGGDIRFGDEGILQALAYDNFADFNDRVSGQSAWRTRFLSAGARYFAPYDIELIGQFMIGTTESALGQKDIWHDRVRFESGFIMASKAWPTSWGAHRLAFRHDIYATEDISPVPRAPRSLGEHGHGLTAAYTLTYADHHRLVAEVNTQRSTRAHRIQFGGEREERETIFQLGYRFMF
ncbi:MAG: hypothetical protein AAF220_00205 [Pseudomonadota bacterium]